MQSDRLRDDVKRALADPQRVVTALALDEGSKRQSSGGLQVRCPAHAEKTAKKIASNRAPCY